MHITPLEDFKDLSGWSGIISGQASLRFAPDTGPSGSAMRLDFDLGDSGGVSIARRPLGVTLPDSFAVLMEVRGEAPSNVFELRLVDVGGANVWRFRDESFDFGSDWRTLRIASRDIDFGSGPAGGGAPEGIEAIEIAITPGSGGRGRFWIADLRLEDRTPSVPPRVRASDADLGQGPECVLDGRPDTRWRAERLPAWVELDFQEVRDFGGLILRWDSPAPRAFRVQVSDTGADWQDIYAAPRSAGLKSFVYLPGGSSRLLRLAVEGNQEAGIPGLVALEVQPEAFARSINDFFHCQAEDSPRGHYPRWLYREQTYWTPVDIPDGGVPALFNEEGMVEVERAGYSIEPFLTVDGALVTWADCTVRQGLVQPPLPIPESFWIHDDLRLSVTAFALGTPGRAILYLRYRVENHGAARRTLGLHLAVRPFQVEPPWQAHRDVGGVRRIRRIGYRDGAVWVNGRLALRPLSTPSGFVAAAFDEGSITDLIGADHPPGAREVMDLFGYASGALRFDLEVESGGTREVFLAAPLGERAESGIRDLLEHASGGQAQLAAALEQWSRILGGVVFQVPAIAREFVETCLGSLAHILINRDGPALHPGPRRAARAWIRDGAAMAAALLRFGREREAGDFVRWYARFQAPDGNVPCCVDSHGVDWLPEHDSHGQFIFAVAEYHRFSGDLDLARDLWPAVLRAVGYLEQLRADRLTPYFQTPKRRACHGLLPESVSHKGDLAHPVHSYWDDFWAVRGLKDAAELAQALGDAPQVARLAVLRDEFRASLYVSIARTMEERAIAYLPGSVESADPDPTAAANALTLIDEGHRLPAVAAQHSFDLFMRGVQGDARDQSRALDPLQRP